MKGNQYIRAELEEYASGTQDAEQARTAAILAQVYEQRTANLLDAYRILRDHGDDTQLAKYINPRDMAAHLAYRLGFGTDDE